MSRPLTGAAKTAQTRRVLLDEARAAIAERPRNPHTVVTLLERADALTPRRPQRFDQCDDTCTTDCGHCKGAGRPVTVVRNDRNMPGGVRVMPLTGSQSPGGAW